MRLPEQALKYWRELLNQVEAARLIADNYILGVIDGLGIDRGSIERIDTQTGEIILRGKENAETGTACDSTDGRGPTVG